MTENKGILKDDVNPFVLKHAVEQLLEENNAYYKQYEIDSIRKKYACGINSFYVPDQLRQIYDELGLVRPDRDIYLGFIELIKKHFSLEQDIVEIGGGYFPRLATKIALQQKTGTITVYDPKLISTTTNIPNLILKRERFNHETIFDKKPGLMIGYMPCNVAEEKMGIIPCNVAEEMLKCACTSDIDFMIALCGCTTYRDEDMCGESWTSNQANAMYLADGLLSKTTMGRLGITTELEKYKNPNPIIFNKRR